MSLSLAIADLIAAARTVAGLGVITDKQEPGNNAYTLTITQGPHERVSRFGPSRVTQALDMTLDVKVPDPAGVAAMISSIETAILADRRRDGNAQTTTNPEIWSITTDEGREGQQLSSSIGVVVYES